VPGGAPLAGVDGGVVGAPAGVVSAPGGVMFVIFMLVDRLKLI
jgi:hypothetical protein